MSDKQAVAVVETVKVVKPAIVIADLEVPKGITVKEHKTCVSFVADSGNKWYLKGRTLEITRIPAVLAKRVEVFTSAVIEKNHLGYVTGVIRDVKDTADLGNLLKHLKGALKDEKAAEKPVTKKAAKTPKAKKTATEETPAVTEPVAEQPLEISA